MTRVVLVFGLLAGAVLSSMMVVNVAFIDRIGFDTAEVIGYTTMILAFLMVYFGIRSYRDNIYGGTISFGKAFGIGLLITLVASVCYVTTWEVIYYWVAPDFPEKYGAYMLEKARQGGATEQELAARAAEMAEFTKMYKNPLLNAGITLIEVLPIGLVVTLVSAAILRRDRASVAAPA
ncbi:MAG TPA: DUF4199 domain-containing protein [Gemmatimonadaceae bacterium]|nr:DUF4199 domain-containing protein [Gemmatimonadaceae bacterium]